MPRKQTKRKKVDFVDQIRAEIAAFVADENTPIRSRRALAAQSGVHDQVLYRFTVKKTNIASKNLNKIARTIGLSVTRSN